MDRSGGPTAEGPARAVVVSPGPGNSPPLPQAATQGREGHRVGRGQPVETQPASRAGFFTNVPTPSRQPPFRISYKYKPTTGFV